jgi:hypothetical protein
MKMGRAAAGWCEGRFLIHTPLQWGAWVPAPRPNRFNLKNARIGRFTVVRLSFVRQRFQPDEIGILWLS